MANFSSKVDIPSRFLFLFAFPCRYVENLSEVDELPDECVLPNIETLERPEAAAPNVEVRTAWNFEGLAFQFTISGKKKALWCNPNRPDESDRVELWLDTRNTKNVHRATRFCHRFACMPTGWGEGDEAIVLPLLINRAKQAPNDVPHGSIHVRSRITDSSWSMYVFFTAASLTGFDPREFREIGINWEVIDRDTGIRTLSAGSPFPYQENPTLWQTLVLANEQSE